VENNKEEAPETGGKRMGPSRLEEKKMIGFGPPMNVKKEKKKKNVSRDGGGQASCRKEKRKAALF